MTGQGSKADRVSQLFDQRCGQFSGFGSALQQNGIYFGRVADEFFVLRSHRRHFAVNALKQNLLGVTPTDAIGISLGQGGGLLGTGKCLVNLKQCRALSVFGNAWGA